MTQLRVPLTARLLFVWVALWTSTPREAAALPEPAYENATLPAGAHQGQGDATSQPDDGITSIEKRHNAGPEGESLGWTLFSTFLSLGAIVVLIYVTLNFGLRRLMVARGMPFGRPGVVKVVERVTLDPKRVLFVVRAAGEYLLVGGAEQGLSLISTLKADEVERVLELARRPTALPKGGGAAGQEGVM
jgi:flagellar protein FliO/FliZ